MKQYRFLLKLKVKDCDVIFKEELGPGVIASQSVVFGPEYDATGIAVALLRQEDLLIQSVIEVQIEGEDDENSLAE